MGSGCAGQLSSHFLADSSCLDLRGVAFNCALPGGLAHGLRVRNIHLCFITSGITLLATHGKLSPHRNCITSSGICSPVHAVSNNVSLGFWSIGLFLGVGLAGGCVVFTATTLLLTSYSLSGCPRNRCISSGRGRRAVGSEPGLIATRMGTVTTGLGTCKAVSSSTAACRGSCKIPTISVTLRSKKRSLMTLIAKCG